jgi:hypothetical protein
MGSQTFREAEPRGLGLAPEIRHYESIILFPENEAKSVDSASQKIMGSQPFREAEPRGLGLAPENQVMMVVVVLGGKNIRLRTTWWDGCRRERK